MSVYDIFTPIPPCPTRRRSTSSLSTASYFIRRPKRDTNKTVGIQYPYPSQVLPTYTRPPQQPSSIRYNHSNIGIIDTSPNLPSSGEMMSTTTRPSTPALSPTSSTSSITYPFPPSPDSPTYNNYPSSTGIIFFPQHNLNNNHVDLQDGEEEEEEEEEEDFFAATPRYHSLIKRNLFNRFNDNNNGGRSSFGTSLGLGLGLGEIPRLPDEPIYPKQPKYNPSPSYNGSPIKNNAISQSSPMDSNGVQMDRSSSSHGELLPSPISRTNSTSYGTQENHKEKRKLPFGHSFLPPLPKTEPGVPQPLIPIGFLSPPPPRPKLAKSPPSSWRPREKQNEQFKQNQQSTQDQDGNQVLTTSRNNSSPLRRTDSDILLPSPFSISASESEAEEEHVKLPPSRLDGHMRKKSNDSQLTIKLGNGFVPLNSSSPSSSTPTQQESDSYFRTHKAMNPSPNQGCTATIRPGIPRYVSQQYQSTRTGNLNLGNRARSFSTSQVNLQQQKQNQSHSHGHQIRRPKSPYKPYMSSPVNSNGRPTSPIPFAFAMDEDYFQENRSNGLQLLHNTHNQNHISSSGTSRFTRPISPSLPEDLLTPGHSPNTYTHQTLSSAPRRPKSPITAREHLNAVLIRHPSKSHVHGEDDDVDDDDGDSLDRLVEAAQRLESGSSYSSYYPKTPPRSPSSRLNNIPLAKNPILRPKPKRGFPILKSLFPPSPPPSSPLIATVESNDIFPPSSIMIDSALNHNEHDQHSASAFDADKVSERLRYQQGRISFAELEGFDRSLLASLHEDQIDEDGDEVDHQMIKTVSSDPSRKEDRRPGTGRRWTLPF